MKRFLAFVWMVGIVPGFLAGKLYTDWSSGTTQASMLAMQRRVAEDSAMAGVYQHSIAAWQQRATACEAKFTVYTIISEWRASGDVTRPLAEMPLLHGLLHVTLATGQATTQSPMVNTPVYVVPAQVDVQSAIPGATYVWQDKSGATRGPFPAQPPAPAK